jgi:hypothetical protein
LPGCDDEQLDWGTIHDADGAFGQIQAAAGELEDGELNLEDRAEARQGKGASGAGLGSLPPRTSTAGEIQDGVLDLGTRAEAQVGNPALLAQSSSAANGRTRPCAITPLRLKISPPTTLLPPLQHDLLLALKSRASGLPVPPSSTPPPKMVNFKSVIQSSQRPRRRLELHLWALMATGQAAAVAGPLLRRPVHP